MSALLKMEEIKNTLAGYTEVYQILAKDLNEAGDLVKEDASNFRLRTFIRTFFALVEGTLYGTKQIALKMHEHFPCFTEAELSLLKEVTYELGDRGRVRERTKYLDTLNNLRFTIKSVAKAFDMQLGMSFDDAGWQSFQYILQIRNQITHPKDASSLVISEDDSGLGQKVDLLLDAAAWYVNVLTKLSNNMLSAINAKYRT